MKILIQGNVVESRAQFITQMIQTNMRAVKNDEICEESPIYQLPCGASYVKAKSMRPKDHNSVIKNYYQVGKASVKEECLTEFLVSILTEPLFDILRTHQQLGYGISCSFRKANNVLGITITVEYQENHIAVDKIDEKIEEFLCEYKGTLTAMTQDDFVAARRCFISSKLTPDTDLEVEVRRNFEEIRNGDNTFNRNVLEAIEIEKVSKSEILEFYEKVFTSKDARKLSVQVVSCVENGKKNSSVAALKQNVIIDDIKLFQESITTYS
jgi:secreted Zn-dependent insulinase-like peptidase